MFSGCTALTSVSLPSGLQSIDEYAFSDCTSLVSITFPEHLREIGRSAFWGCSALKEIEFPSSLTEIADWAFSGCRNLVSVIIPNSVESIGPFSFNSFSYTTTIYAPVGSYARRYAKEHSIPFTTLGTSVEEEAASEFLIENGIMDRYNGSGGDIIVPDGVTTIDYMAFADYRSNANKRQEKINSISLPDSLTVIRDNAFSGCSELSSIVIPASFEAMPASAFQDCPNLKDITILSSALEFSSKWDAELLKDCTIFAPCLAPSKFHSDLRQNVLRTFCSHYEKGEVISEESIGVYTKYIRNQKKKLLENPENYPGLVAFMIRESILKLEDISPLLERSTNLGDTATSTLLLEYQNNHFSIAQREQHENKKMQNTWKLLDEGSMSVSAAKKVWRFENMGRGRIKITGYIGNERDVIVPTKIGEFAVTSIGDHAFSPEGKRLTETQKESRRNLLSVVINQGVTEICDKAFYNCKALTSVTIPDGVSNIGGETFFGCEALTSVTVPNGVEIIQNGTFSQCTHLGSVIIPASVTEIGPRAFSNCGNLKKCPIPDSLSSIGDFAFSYCSVLDGICLPDNLIYLGRRAFSMCRGLTEITIPKTVSKIGNATFEGCSSLHIKVHEENNNYHSISNCLIERVSRTLLFANKFSKVPRDGSVAVVGEYAMGHCDGLVEQVIPDGVSVIQQCAFSECKDLVSVSLPQGLSEIHGCVFENCSSLTSIEIPNSIVKLQGFCFRDCVALTSITLSDHIKTIESGTFNNCNKLTEITMPKNVEVIESYAFEKCTSLSSIGLPDGLKEIDSFAFEGCKNLKSIIIPESVCEINYGVFNDCPSLTIRGKLGSYAEEYAKKNNIPFAAL